MVSRGWNRKWHTYLLRQPSHQQKAVPRLLHARTGPPSNIFKISNVVFNRGMILLTSQARYQPVSNILTWKQTNHQTQTVYLHPSLQATWNLSNTITEEVITRLEQKARMKTLPDNAFIVDKRCLTCRTVHFFGGLKRQKILFFSLRAQHFLAKIVYIRVPNI